MTGWFSIKETTPGRWVWVLYANNMREILRSARTFNQANHARDAARRLQKIVTGASHAYGKFMGRPQRLLKR